MISTIFAFTVVITSVDARTVNIVFTHRQTFQVNDDGHRMYIRLPDEHEKLLEIGDIVPLHLQLNVTEEDNVNEKVSEENTGDAEGGDDMTQSNSKDKGDYKDDFNDFDDRGVENDDDYDDYNNVQGDKDEARDEQVDDYDNDESIRDDSTELTNENENSDETEDVTNKKGAVLNFDDIKAEELDLDTAAGLKRLYRRKRSVKARNSDGLLTRLKRRVAAREQWRETLPGSQPAAAKKNEPTHWQEITDEDLKNGQLARYKVMGEYIGMTLLSTSVFIFIGVCFARDPLACIFAFGTGCPCCLICCPCIRKFVDKYTNVKQLVKDSMNRYMPGVIVKDDGTLDYYEPTTEEIEILMEIIEEASGESMSPV